MRREPVFNIPGVILALLAVLAAIQFGRGFLTPDADIDLIAKFAFVPARLSALIHPAGMTAVLAALTAANDADAAQRIAVARFFLQSSTPVPLTLLTYAFLHGGWAHVGLNGLWLLAFGSPVARRFGTARFLLFMAVAAVAGAVTHWACFPYGLEPVIGASAAVSGCMGAAIRFAFRPPDRPGYRNLDTVSAPPLSLVGVLRDRRAMSFAVVWFVSNALFGIGSVSFGMTDAPVAWQAHVGGFLAGLLLFVPFDPLRRPPEPSDTASEEDPQSAPDRTGLNDGLQRHASSEPTQAD